ncbi:aspartate carbamoyltransferase [bacterium]|nr:aspartate carbamoyltransferase [bacterium]
MKNSLHHIISASQFKKSDVFRYIANARRFRTESAESSVSTRFQGKTVVNMFYEPSTRTNCSFQAAAHKLGCNVISLTEAASSSKKGESLEDTIRTLGCYAEAIVLRHPERGAAHRAAKASRIPIINAGDGNGEHPTQALLDVYTIYEELAAFGLNIDSPLTEITVCFVGDLKNSRTVHSLVYLLGLLANVRFIFLSPKSLEIPQMLADIQIANGHQVLINTMSLDEALPLCDVLYMTRIQKERFATEFEYETVMANRRDYSIDGERMERAKQQMIVMHPLPRLDEIAEEVDKDPRAAYFRQVENGLYMRMAILEQLLEIHASIYVDNPMHANSSSSLSGEQHNT